MALSDLSLFVSKKFSDSTITYLRLVSFCQIKQQSTKHCSKQVANHLGTYLRTKLINLLLYTAILSSFPSSVDVFCLLLLPSVSAISWLILSTTSAAVIAA